MFVSKRVDLLWQMCLTLDDTVFPLLSPSNHGSHKKEIMEPNRFNSSSQEIVFSLVWSRCIAWLSDFVAKLLFYALNSPIFSSILSRRRCAYLSMASATNLVDVESITPLCSQLKMQMSKKHFNSNDRYLGSKIARALERRDNHCQIFYHKSWIIILPEYKIFSLIT